MDHPLRSALSPRSLRQDWLGGGLTVYYIDPFSCIYTHPQAQPIHLRIYPGELVFESFLDQSDYKKSMIIVKLSAISG